MLEPRFGICLSDMDLELLSRQGPEALSMPALIRHAGPLKVFGADVFEQAEDQLPDLAANLTEVRRLPHTVVVSERQLDQPDWESNAAHLTRHHEALHRMARMVELGALNI